MQEMIQKLWCASVEVEGIAASMMMRKADQRYISRCLPLLQAKIDEIKALAANIEGPVESLDIKPVNDFKEPETQALQEEQDEQEVQEELEKQEDLEKGEVQEETSTESETLNTETDTELPPIENPSTEDIEEVAEPTTLEQAEDNEIAEEEANAEEINEVETAEEITTPEIDDSETSEDSENSEVSDNLEISEPTQQVDVIQPTEPQPQNNSISLDEKLSRKISKNFRQAISLNDKFRFRRELFGNSSQQYDAALDLIAEMSSFDEARNYFLDSYGWDAENPDVKSFFAILSNHYTN